MTPTERRKLASARSCRPMRRASDSRSWRRQFRSLSLRTRLGKWRLFGRAGQNSISLTRNHSLQ